jgi:hypothetical protein
MRRSPLLVTLALVLGGPCAFAQQPMQPYAAPEPLPAQQPMQPYADQAAPPQVVVPPPPAVPPPLVVPPPGGYYAAPTQPMPYYQPCPQQPRLFHEEMQPNYGLMIAGVVIFGASWSINAATAYIADEWKLAVPIVGPFMETQNVYTGAGYDANRLLVGLLVFDGLIETAGAIMLVAGAITHHKVRIYDKPRMSVSVVPTAGPASGGLAAFGSF